MTRTNALAKIKKLLTCNAEEREADIQLSSRLRDIVPLDTLFHAFIGEVEEMFELNTMTPKQLDRLVTVGNLLNYVLDEIGEDEEEAPTEVITLPKKTATAVKPEGKKVEITVNIPATDAQIREAGLNADRGDKNSMSFAEDLTTYADALDIDTEDYSTWCGVADAIIKERNRINEDAPDKAWEELPLGDPRNPDAPATINTPAGVFELDQLAEEAYIAYGKRTHAPSQFTSRWNQLTPVGKEAWRDAVRSVVTTILS